MGREFKFCIIRVHPDVHQDLMAMVYRRDFSMNTLLCFLIEEFLDSHYFGESGCVDAQALLKKLEASEAEGGY